MKRKLNQFADASRILHGFVILGFILAIMVSIFSCQEYYIGKTEEELYREMFEFMIESLEVDGTKVWQDH